jgi:glyoxylase I family protein
VPGIDHLDLVVSSLERSLPFYRGLLAPLGWTSERVVTGERGEPIHYLNRRDGHSSIGIRAARSGGVVDRYAPGVHHVCLAARNRRQVEERFTWACANGATPESEPREHTYTPGYYAGFFLDPDGIKLEVVHRPRLRTLLWVLRGKPDGE